MTRLHEPRAWEIALAVAEPLRGRVQLVSTLTRSRDAVSSYRWLQLTVPDPDRQPEPFLKNTLAWVEQARAACVVWHLLAFFDVDGEEGLAFPRFQVKVPFSLAFDEPLDPEVTARYWQTLDEEEDDDPFIQLMRDVHQRDQAQDRDDQEQREEEDADEDEEMASDEDGNDVKIQTAQDWFDAVVRTFAGWEDVAQNTALAGYIEELLPYVDTTRYFEKPVEIGVLMCKFYPLKKMAGKIKRVITDFNDDTRADRVTLVAQLKQGRLRFPQVQFNEFAMEYMESMSNHVEMRYLSEIIETCPIVIPNVRFKLSRRIDDATLMRFVLSMCRCRSNEAALVERMSVEFGKALPRQVEILFSAMPILLVSSLELLNARGTMSRNGWAWFAYALYSPLAKYSGIKTLDIRDADVTEPEAIALRESSIAHKALYSLLHRSDDNAAPPSRNDESKGRYVLVDVENGTSCFRTSQLSGEPFLTFPKRCRMMAVVKNTVNTMDELDNAVCVIVTACGHGWVAKHNISGLKVRPAQKAVINNVCMGPGFADNTMKFSSLSPLLNHVKFLDIFEWGQLDAEDMRELFKTCRNLTDLVVQHRGDVFSSWTTDPCTSALRLKGLNMVCYEQFGPMQAPSQDAWRTCLSELTKLSIHTFGPRERHEKAVRQFLHDGYGVIRFEWGSCAWKRSKDKPRYDAKRVASRSILGITPGVLDKAQRPMSARARAAFVSAIKLNAQRGSRHPVGTLSQDVAKLICSFSTTDVNRVVWVDDS